MKLSSLFAACVLSAATLAAPARAEDYLGFQSPTGNIQCGLYRWSGGASVRCDLTQLTPSYTRAPADCEFDWGSSFAVDDRGKGYLACVSDAVGDPSNGVLPYGEAVSLGGISCVSARTGMTCTNAEGHGFTISKAKQKVF
ncbi:MAG: DUF6636 domain-containing protein [Tabrizicola flagellatus]|uniref:DUF6636 domain-containing protein n=1 Tax=Tabrizicola flagellatus TaxID=2593021 RepID=UPI00391A047D